MFVLNDDKSIYATRGDIVFFNVTAEEDSKNHIFKAGDVLRIKVFGKKDAENVVLQKDFPVTEDTEMVEIFLTEEDTKIGEVISKPKDYWYEVELNPHNNPQTIIGYDEDGAKVFKLFPEGDDIPEFVPDPEDVRVIDTELDMTSDRPVQNQAIARAVVSLRADFEGTKEYVDGRCNDTAMVAQTAESAVAVERARIDSIVAHNTDIYSKTLDYLDFITEETKAKIDGQVQTDGVYATMRVNLREANLVYGGTTMDVFIIQKECRPIDTGLIHAEDGLEYRISYDSAKDHYFMSLRATSDVAPSGAGAVTFSYKLGDYELKDIRVGADGVTYASAGTAVRAQFAYSAAEINALKEDIPFDIVSGTITNGIEDSHANRARFVQKIRACRTVVTIPQNDVYLYGYVTYDENGDFDGQDHGWNTMNGSPLLVENGYFKMNFRKVVDGAMTEEDFEALKAMLSIKQFNILYDVENIVQEMAEGTATILPYEVELGSLTNGEKTDFTTRARFVEKVKVNSKTVATIAEHQNYMYGYCVYDESGVYDGVDHGWNAPADMPEVGFEHDGYVMFNFRRTDAGEITEADMAVFAEMLTIVSQKSLMDVDAELKALEKKIGSVPANMGSLASINVEYGRYKGASYVFARIPETTNEGVTLMPKLRLTSIDGSLDGSKVSALNFAKRENTIFAMNAGLFNTQTLQPVGQTIIDGVSVVNVPMTDDMGNPISDVECYPLCIDAEGNLSAPYPRSVDTADMIADGVKYAVTGWGKIIDNFKACTDTVENEIVHAETYIRQVIGQFQNGDYFVCTVDKSRNHVQNEAGLTYKDLAQLLMDKGVKFAYSLDGGGSAETVIGVRQLNPIYEGTAGRAVPTVITFE